MNELLRKSAHQHRVEDFMHRAKQAVPLIPTLLTDEERILRARLIHEETFETIEALGVSVSYELLEGQPVKESFTIFKEMDLEEVVDGCCDLKVVTTGTLSACGIPDIAFQQEVDQNNLRKFGPGHSWDDYGKLIKPEDHKPPRLKDLLMDVIEEASGI